MNREYILQNYENADPAKVDYVLSEWKVLDPNNDGTITLDEFKSSKDRYDQEFYDFSKVTDEVMEQSFRMLDSDKDGRITRDEYLSYILN